MGKNIAASQGKPKKQPGIVRFFTAIWEFIYGTIRAFIDGDIWVKLSALVGGASCFARKQYVKGFLICLVEAVLIWAFPGFLWPYMSKLGTLGTVVAKRTYNPETRKNEWNDYDNSFLILLFGVIGCVLLLTPSCCGCAICAMPARWKSCRSPVSMSIPSARISLSASASSSTARF